MRPPSPMPAPAPAPAPPPVPASRTVPAPAPPPIPAPAPSPPATDLIPGTFRHRQHEEMLAGKNALAEHLAKRDQEHAAGRLAASQYAPAAKPE